MQDSSISTNKKAVVLFSGGLDSTTVLAYAQAQGFECYALSFNYQQKHHSELDAAARIAKSMGAKAHKVFHFDIGQFGGSALTDDTMEVPDFAGDHKIPATYVPARNTIFLSVALGWAEILGAEAIFLGISGVDYSGYPDCRPEYLASFQEMANLATKAGVEGRGIQIIAPLVHLSKAETVELGLKHGVDYSMTVSCYRADEEGRACGTCDSCVLRKKGFADAGLADPTRYQSPA